MEPFSKDDPLHKLLGKSRVAEPRPNFTQNVLRAVRQEPQRMGFWERCRAWLEEESAFKKLNHGVLATAAVLTLSLVVWKQTDTSAGNRTDVAASKSATSSEAVEAVSTADVPVEAVVASELESLDHLSVMLAQQDASAMTDSEIVSLLY
ncbi:hypothetical protein DES53_113121 [Roseimicrobium gellanilyticum]|uniref:Uncharacterized protein n=1 Tax=Roseimicrobium gellanilyticum TaxID=748857 RepID=A0A366H6J1_9BACT|nr:hypothetical protein [Roseimicrobium gellanilyticum]RBP37739.1 hypothetical protein DES53_113121 [Roseimicrobium gellanilyticum]